jgi:hypothetical protein
VLVLDFSSFASSQSRVFEDDDEYEEDYEIVVSPIIVLVVVLVLVLDFS